MVAKKLVPVTLAQLMVSYNVKPAKAERAPVQQFDSTDLDAAAESAAIRKAHISHRSRWRSK